MAVRRERGPPPRKILRQKSIFLCVLILYFWLEGRHGGQFPPAKRSAPSESDLREVVWTFQPQTHNDVADTKRNSSSNVSPLLFVPVSCLPDNCLQPVLQPFTRCKHVERSIRKRKKPYNFQKIPHQRPGLISNGSATFSLSRKSHFTHTLETFWLTVCDFSSAINRRRVEVCVGGNGHRDNYPTCKNGLWLTPQMEGNKLHGEGSN